MEGDVMMLPGVVTNVATEGWGVQPVDKTVAEHSGVDGVRLRCVQPGGQHLTSLRGIYLFLRLLYKGHHNMK